MMRHTGKNRDNDLGCLSQSAFVAVLLIVIIILLLDKLEGTIVPTGIELAEEQAADAEYPGGQEEPDVAATPAETPEETVQESVPGIATTETAPPETTDTAEVTDVALVEPVSYDPAMVAEGEGLFITVCAACHNYDAHGIERLGFDLVASEFVGSLNDQELLTFIVEGRPYWDAANTTGVSMPPRGGLPEGHTQLSNENILKIIAFIRTLRLQAAP